MSTEKTRSPDGYRWDEFAERRQFLHGRSGITITADLTVNSRRTIEQVPIDEAFSRWPWLSDHRVELWCGKAVFAGMDAGIGTPGATQGVFVDTVSWLGLNPQPGP